MADSVHPYLRQETRRNALTAALRNLSDIDLDDAQARAEAYAAAAVAPVTPAEDALAVERQRKYWRCVSPRAVALLADMAAARIIERRRAATSLPHAPDPRLA